MDRSTPVSYTHLDVYKRQELESHTVQNTIRTLVTLVTRVSRLLLFFMLALPGSILFTPIFIGSSIYSKKKAREGLKKSLVKIKGTDLLATWKLILALVMAPISYVTYSLILISLHSRKNGWVQWIWVPSENVFIQFPYFYMQLVLTTYGSLKTGEIGMDLFKSLRPLVVTLMYPGKKIREIQSIREQLSEEITSVCNELGPSVFKDFDQFAINNEIESERGRGRYEKEKTPDYLKIQRDPSRSRSRGARSRSSSISSFTSRISNAISRVNSRGSLSDIPILSEARYSSNNVINDSDSSCSSSDEENIKAGSTSKISSLMRARWEKSHDKEE